MTKLPSSPEFGRFDTVVLDINGQVDPAGGIAVRDDTTDIFVFVHGWRNGPDRAGAHARRLFAALDAPAARTYFGRSAFVPQFISVRWPSTSGIGPRGYRRIRDRAHTIASPGPAAGVLGALLGYVDNARVRPGGPPTLRTATGQYLHCVGHSFGGRLLGEAILSAADPVRPPVLAWPWPSTRPFAVDNFVAIQMAAPPTIFRDRFAALLSGEAPIAGPIIATFSRHDHALGRPHRLMEHTVGVGAVGVLGAPIITMHPVEEPYRHEEFSRITNVDASRVFAGGPPLMGAHARVWHRETAHLLLSVAALARE